ncbi:hypothetical protein HPB47_012110 [Ixodes persulcatus]|uniref:Uncharacterized protein n=1 Tax=Ixodes persulcatus TaxID=34615 RepID=A0AC60NUP3_IXOPE|nr:hypothetical protein HPB47_012110 [Ixodes persulcatus]
MWLVVRSMLMILPLVGAQEDCDNAFTHAIPRENHPSLAHLTDDVFEAVMQCPSDIECCSDGSFSCFDWAYLTCSCSDNCEDYGDCCWNCTNKVIDLGSAPSKSPWQCISLALAGGVTKSVQLVSGCSDTWPSDDEVRSKCERVDASMSTIYFGIPVTSNSSRVTYRNGFCALCNYDVGSVTFWDVIEIANNSKLRLQPPDYLTVDIHKHLRRCSKFAPLDTCPVGTSTTVSQMCRMYFAPVVEWRGLNDETYYKNAYCAYCNGANFDLLSCLPPEKIQNFTTKDPKISVDINTLDLSSIFRTVGSNETCFSGYNGTCYIQDVTYRYINGTELEATTSSLIRAYLTMVCISVSLVCLMLKLIVYIFHKQCRTFSSQCTLCLSMTLFFTQLCFLIFNVLDFGQGVCVGVAIVLHYGFLSTSFWTTVLSYDIWKTLILVRRPSGSCKSFPLYSACGWGSPLLFIAVASALNWAASTSYLSPSYGIPRCFINRKWAHLTFFLLPMISLLLVDVGFYLHTIFTIKKTESQSHKFEFKTSESPSRILLFVKLAFIMGASWLLGLLSAVADSLLIDCASIMLVGLQGVYLFLGFRDHRHLFRLLSSSSVISGLFTSSRSRSSTLGTTDGAHASQNRLDAIGSHLRSEGSSGAVTKH